MGMPRELRARRVRRLTDPQSCEPANVAACAEVLIFVEAHAWQSGQATGNPHPRLRFASDYRVIGKLNANSEARLQLGAQGTNPLGRVLDFRCQQVGKDRM